MIYFILTIYLLSAINVFITEMKIENGFIWSLFLAITYPIWEAFGGALWLLLGLEKLIFRVFERKHT